MTFYIAFLLLQSWFASQINAEPISCLSCPRVTRPEDCRTSLLCAEGEICQTEQYITDEGHVFYGLGCKQEDICKSTNALVGTDELRARMNNTRAYPLVGRRQLDNIAAYVCIECCDTPYCNNFLCGGHETALECASCQNVDSLEECNKIEICRPHQSCYVSEVITDRFELQYEAGCRAEAQCDELLRDQQINGQQGPCKKCCSQAMCNTVCAEPPSTTSLWTTSAVTTKSPATQAVTTTLPTAKVSTTLANVITKGKTPVTPPKTPVITNAATTTVKSTTRSGPVVTNPIETTTVSNPPSPSTEKTTVYYPPSPSTEAQTSSNAPSPSTESTTVYNPPSPSTEASTARLSPRLTNAATTTPGATTTTVCPTLPYLSYIAPPKLFTNILHGVGCKEKADIAFLLDSSDNFNGFDEKELLRFVKGYTSSLDIGPDDTRVSVTLYNNRYQTHITLDNVGESQENVSVHLDRLTNRDLTMLESRLSLALSGVHKEFDNSSRPDAHKYMVILTQDNITDVDMAINKAREIKSDNITIFVIGIGKFEGMMDKLTKMVSSPTEQHLVKVRYAGDLASVLEDLLLGHCRDQRNPQVQQPCWDKSEFNNETCKADEDTLIILDASSNVKPENWQKIQSFLKLFINKYDGSSVNSTLGLFTYNTHVHSVFPFKPFFDKLLLRNRTVEELKHQVLTGLSLTEVALERALKMFQKDDRDAIKNVILFTNGKSIHKMRTLTAALQLQRYGVNIYVVGVGDNVDLKEQMILASNPDVDHVLKFGGEDELITHLEYMAAKKCNKKFSSAASI